MKTGPIAALGIVLLVGTAGCATTGIPADRAGNPEYVKITGSRIPQPAERMKGIPATVSPLHVVSRRDIERTGAAETAGALDYLPFVEILR